MVAIIVTTIRNLGNEMSVWQLSVAYAATASR